MHPWLPPLESETVFLYPRVSLVLWCLSSWPWPKLHCSNSESSFCEDWLLPFLFSWDVCSGKCYQHPAPKLWDVQATGRCSSRWERFFADVQRRSELPSEPPTASQLPIRTSHGNPLGSSRLTNFSENCRSSQYQNSLLNIYNLNNETFVL